MSSSYHRWDAIYAIPFDEVNTRLRTDADRELLARAHLRSLLAHRLYQASRGGFFGYAADTGGTYEKAATAQATAADGTQVPVSPTYRILEVVVVNPGTGYTQAFQKAEINLAYLRPATFACAHGLVGISFNASGQYSVGSPPVVTLSNGGTAEAILDASGNITEIKLLTRGTAGAVTITVADDTSTGATCTATAIFGPYLTVLDGGEGYAAFPTTADLEITPDPANAGAGASGFQVRFVVAVDGTAYHADPTPGPALLTADNLPLITVTHDPADPQQTDHAVVMSGMGGGAERIINVFPTTFREALSRALCPKPDENQLYGAAGDKDGLVKEVVDALWKPADWTLAGTATDAATCTTTLTAKLRGVIDGYADADSLSGLFASLLKAAFEVLWQYSDKHKPAPLWLAEAAKRQPDDPYLVAFVRTYLTLTENNTLTNAQAAAAAYNKALAGALARIGAQTERAVLGLNSAYAYHHTGRRLKTVADVESTWHPRMVGHPALQELLIEALTGLAPATGQDSLCGLGRLPLPSPAPVPLPAPVYDTFKLRLGAWQLVSSPTAPPEELTFAIPVAYGILRYGTTAPVRVVQVLAAHEMSILVTVKLSTVGISTWLKPLEAKDLRFEELRFGATASAHGLSLDELGRLEAFVRRSVTHVPDFQPSMYAAGFLPYDAAFARAGSGVLASLNVVADIPPQVYQPTNKADTKSWLTPHALSYYTRPRLEAADNQLLIGMRLDNELRPAGGDLSFDAISADSGAQLLLSPATAVRYVYLPSVVQWFFRDEALTEPARRTDFDLSGAALTNNRKLYFKENFLTDYSKPDQQPMKVLVQGKEDGESGFLLELLANGLEMRFRQVEVLTPNADLKGTISRTISGQYVVSTEPGKDAQLGGAKRFRLAFFESGESPVLAAAESVSWYNTILPYAAGALAIATVATAGFAVRRKTIAASSNPEDGAVWYNRLWKKFSRYLHGVNHPRTNQVAPRVWVSTYRSLGTFIRSKFSAAVAYWPIDGEIEGPLHNFRYVLNGFRNTAEGIVADITRTSRTVVGQVVNEVYQLAFAENGTNLYQRRLQVPRQRDNEQVNLLPVPEFNQVAEHVHRVLLEAYTNKYATVERIFHTADVIFAGLTGWSTYETWKQTTTNTKDKEKYTSDILKNQFAVKAREFLYDVKPFFGTHAIVSELEVRDGLRIGFATAAVREQVTFIVPYVVPFVNRARTKYLRCQHLGAVNTAAAAVPLTLQLAELSTATEGYQKVGKPVEIPVGATNNVTMADFEAPNASLLVVSAGASTEAQEFSLEFFERTIRTLTIKKGVFGIINDVPLANVVSIVISNPGQRKITGQFTADTTKGSRADSNLRIGTAVSTADRDEVWPVGAFFPSNTSGAKTIANADGWMLETEETEPQTVTVEFIFA